MLDQDTTKKRQVHNKQLDIIFEDGNNKEYNVDGICDSAVYARATAGQLLALYYLAL